MAAIEEGDEILTYARIDAQGIRIPMPRCKVDRVINDGDVLKIGDRSLEVWSTPGHTAGRSRYEWATCSFRVTTSSATAASA